MVRPTISADECVGRDLGRVSGVGGDVAAVAEDRRGVAERVDFLHAVRDVEDHAALVAQPADDLEEAVGLAAGQGLLVGSSKAMTLASRESALAISTIWRCAMESVPTSVRGSMSSPSSSS